MKLNFNKIFNGTKKFASKHATTILTFVGVGGMLTAGVLAVKATPKATNKIEYEKAVRSQEKGELVEKLPVKDVVKLTWKEYVPPITLALTSAGCCILANRMDSKRNAALAAMYTLTETALSDYKTKVIETIGEEKEKEIKEAIITDKISKCSIDEEEAFRTGKGDTLCYDLLTGRSFYSDYNEIMSAENRFNKRLISEDYLTLNEWYYELGIPVIKIGDQLGWNIGRDIVDVSISSMVTSKGKPCLVLDYKVGPRYDYASLM